MDRLGLAAAGAGAANGSSHGSLRATLAQRVLEAVPEIIYVYDLQEEKGVFQNRRLGELLGREPKAAHDITEWERYLHPDDAKRFVAYRETAKSIRPGEIRSWEFRLLHEDGSWRWFRTRDVLLEADKSGAPRLMVGTATDVTEQKKSEEHKDVVLGELRHRARNATAMIEAIGRQSLPTGQPEVEAYYLTFVARLRALFQAGELVLASSERLAALGDVVEMALRPFRPEPEETRIRTGGPAVELSEQVAGTIALSLHELSTNASKYGALSASAGTVDLFWRIEGTSVVLEWKEHGGPPVNIPNHEGFGTRVIRYLATRQVGGTVDLAFEPDGVHCRLKFEPRK